MDVHLYTFEDADGAEDPFQTDDLAAARDYARANRLVAYDNVFEYADRTVLTDHRSST